MIRHHGINLPLDARLPEKSRCIWPATNEGMVSLPVALAIHILADNEQVRTQAMAGSPKAVAA
jgi:hypothetical protein